MMQPADQRDRDHPSLLAWFDVTFIRRVAIQGQVSPRIMVVFEVRSKDPLQMSLVEHDHVLKALAFDRTDDPLRVRILPWRSRRTDDFFDTHMFDPLAEETAVNSVAVTNQKSWRFVIRKGFDDLLRGPFRRRMCGDVETNNAPTIMTQDDERKQEAKGRRWNSEEVDTNDVSEVVIQERSPGLRRWLSTTDHVLVNGCLGHVVAEQAELGVDSRRAPCRVLATHAANQLPDFHFDPRPP